MPSLKRAAGRACATLAVALTLILRLGAVDAAESQLELHKPVERRLSGGESHRCRIALQGGESAALTVEQRGIDIAIRVSDGADNTIATFDQESRAQGQEHALIVADQAAIYQINVSARYPRDPAGNYEVRVDDIRRATGRDRLVDQAHRIEAAVERPASFTSRRMGSSSLQARRLTTPWFGPAWR